MNLPGLLIYRWTKMKVATYTYGQELAVEQRCTSKVDNVYYYVAMLYTAVDYQELQIKTTPTLDYISIYLHILKNLLLITPLNEKVWMDVSTATIIGMKPNQLETYSH